MEKTPFHVSRLNSYIHWQWSKVAFSRLQSFIVPPPVSQVDCWQNALQDDYVGKWCTYETRWLIPQGWQNSIKLPPPFPPPHTHRQTHVHTSLRDKPSRATHCAAPAATHQPSGNVRSTLLCHMWGAGYFLLSARQLPMKRVVLYM